MAQEQVVEKTRRSALKRIPLATRMEKASEVAVTGDFNQWAEKGISLAKDAAGRWHVTLTLSPGERQYRLRVDGQWQDHPEAEKRVPNPFGSEHCVLTVGKS